MSATLEEKPRVAKSKPAAPRPLGLQDYRLLFCDVRFFVETAFTLLNTSRTNRNDQIAILKTTARLMRVKVLDFYEREMNEEKESE